MSHLTIETMNTINFLLTEVSLECLGNKFFDVYGNQADSLLRLISANTLKPELTDADTETELWKSLTATKKKPKIIIKPIVQTEPVGIRKRRASFSNTNNDADGNSEPESLLVPMAPKAAKIANRRSTISVQLAKSRRQALSNQTSRHSKQMGDVILVNETSPSKMRKQTFEKPTRNKTIAEIQAHLRRDTDTRKFFFSHVSNSYLHRENE